MTSVPGYLVRLMAAFEAGHFSQGELSHVEVQHGPGCRKLPCTCHPSVTVFRETDVLVIGEGGHVLERRAKS